MSAKFFSVILHGLIYLKIVYNIGKFLETFLNISEFIFLAIKCVTVCGFVYISGGTRRVQKLVSDSLLLQLKVIVILPDMGFENEFTSSEAEYALNCGAILQFRAYIFKFSISSKNVTVIISYLFIYTSINYFG